MAKIELTPSQAELLRHNGYPKPPDTKRSLYEWFAVWDFLWSALYHGWLDDNRKGRDDAKAILRAMAQATAEESARDRGLEAGEAVLLAPLEEQLLVSLHLPAVIYTGMPGDEWQQIQDGLHAALQKVGIDDLFEDTYNYIQLCFDIIHEMDETKRRAEGGKVVEIIDELLEYKRELAFALLTKYDPLQLGPGEEDGEDIDAYIWEGEVIGPHVFKCDTPERAAHVIAYVLGKSFDVPFEDWEVMDIAEELIERMPDDLVEPGDYPSFEHDVRPLIDRHFAFYEERLPWLAEEARQWAIEEGEEPDFYEDVCYVHFLTKLMSDYGMKKRATGEVRRPRVDVWSRA